MNPNFLGGDRYSAFALSGLAEIPGVLLAAFAVNLVGRKFMHIMGFSICGILLLLTLAIPIDPKNPKTLGKRKYEWNLTNISIANFNYQTDPEYRPIATALVTISKGAITMVYALIYIFTPELFPTVLRSLAMGTCSMAARIGAVGASFIAMYLVRFRLVSVF